MTEVVVNELFPLSKAAVGEAFQLVNPNVGSKYRDFLRTLSVRALSNRSGLYGNRLYKRYSYFISRSDFDKSFKEKKIYEYETGLLIGYRAMLAEAAHRAKPDYGVLPDIPREIFRTWSQDDLSHFVEDAIQATQMIRGAKTNEGLGLLRFIDKFNMYGSGRLNYFMQSEPALVSAYEQYFPSTNGKFNAYMHTTQGIFDICSVVKANADIERLKKQFKGN